MTFDEWWVSNDTCPQELWAKGIARTAWDVAQRAAFEEAAKIAEQTPDANYPQTGIREEAAYAIRERAAEIPPRQE